MSDSTQQILVIDDDPVFNRVLSRALKQRGHSVVSACSAALAGTKAGERMPPAIRSSASGSQA